MPAERFYPGDWTAFQDAFDPDVPESQPKQIPATFRKFLGELSARAVYSYDTTAQRDSLLYPTPGVTYYAFTRDTNTLWASTGTTWSVLAVAGGAPWSSFTPRWHNQSNTTLGTGNGTLTARYEIVGKTLRAGITLLRGTSTNQGAPGDLYYFDLPSGMQFKNFQMVTGTGLVRQFNGDTNSTMYEAVGNVVGIGSSTVAMVMNNTNTRLGQAYKVSSSVTNGWSPGDIVSFGFEGEVA